MEAALKEEDYPGISSLNQGYKPSVLVDGTEYGMCFLEEKGKFTLGDSQEERNTISTLEWNTRYIDVPEKDCFPGTKRALLHIHDGDPKDADVTVFLNVGFGGNPLQFKKLMEETLYALYDKGFSRPQIYAPLTMGMGMPGYCNKDLGISGIRLNDKQEDHGDIIEEIIKTDQPGGQFYFIGHSAGEQIGLGGIERILEGSGDVREQLWGILNINGVKQIPWEWLSSPKTVQRVLPYLTDVLKQTAQGRGCIDLREDQMKPLFFDDTIEPERLRGFSRFSLPDSGAMFGGDFALPWEMDPVREGGKYPVPQMIWRTLIEQRPKPRKLDELAEKHGGKLNSLARQIRIVTSKDGLLGGKGRARTQNKLRAKAGLKPEGIKVVHGTDAWHCLPVSRWNMALESDMRLTLRSFFPEKKS